MPKKMKNILRTLRKILIVVSIIYIVSTISVKIQSVFVKQEFKEFEKIAYLVDREFEWEVKDYNMIHVYKSKEMWGYDYVITPLGRFYARWLYSPGAIELKYPSTTLREFNKLGFFIYPTNELAEKNEEVWDEQKVSFDQGYSLSEVEKEFGFSSMEWLWVDTYKNTDPNQYEYFKIWASLDNCAYGIPCSGYDTLESAAEAFVSIMNEYQEKKKSVTGKLLHKIKTGIKEEGELTLDDIVIIGGLFKGNFNKESRMIKVLNPRIYDETGKNRVY